MGRDKASDMYVSITKQKSPNMRYRTLRAERVIKTTHKLKNWVSKGFPDAGFADAVVELGQTVRRCAAEVARLRRPAPVIRISVSAICGVSAF